MLDELTVAVATRVLRHAEVHGIHEAHVGEVVAQRSDALVAPAGALRRDVGLGLLLRVGIASVTVDARQREARVHLLDAGVTFEAALLLGGGATAHPGRTVDGCDRRVAPGEERAERRRQERQSETETQEHARTAQPRAARRTEPFENFALARIHI